MRRSVIRSTAAFAALALGCAAMPAAAATVSIKNCYSAPIDITVLDTQPRVSRAFTYDLATGGTWQGSCQTDPCWVSVSVPGRGVASSYTGSICAFDQGGLSLKYAPCPC